MILWTSTIVDQKERRRWVFFSSQVLMVGEEPHYTDEEYLEACRKKAPHLTLRIRPPDAGNYAEEAIRLREEEGLTYREIGERLGVKTGTIGQCFYRRGGVKKGPNV